MTLSEAVAAFIRQKHDSGFAYVSLSLQLGAFSRNTGSIELTEVSSAHIESFLDSAVSTYTWRRRYAQLADFFRYWHARGETRPVVLPEPRPHERRNFRPHVYSRTELRAILDAVKRLPRNGNSTHDPETIRTLLLVLYGTGMRLSEALALRSEDVDAVGRVLHVTSRGKAGRAVPIGKDIARVLRRYSKWKTRKGLMGEPYFVREGGVRLYRDTLYDIFHKLLELAGVSRRDRLPHRPRIHDLRCTFAVHQVGGWILQGRDLNRLLPALAHYMGLKDLNATEQFLNLTPERFRKELRKLSPAEAPSKPLR